MINATMKIGIAAATAFEIEPAIQYLTESGFKVGDHEFEILVTGIGCTAATYQITNFVKTQSPAYMIQAGICGAFSQLLRLGEPVVVIDEIIGDQGVEENNLFKDMFDMGFIDAGNPPYSAGKLVNPDKKGINQTGLRVVHGVTVNQVTTAGKRIAGLQEKYNCDVESMEGAALHYVCIMEGVPFLQLRSVSNYIGERDKTNWRLKESIINLNRELINIIKQQKHR